MELNKYLKQFERMETPFYFYDTDLLKKTFSEASKQASTIPNALIHFAIKSNDNNIILDYAHRFDFGVDTVSGGEIEKSIKAGIPGNKIMFAGVGKTDKEINIGLDHDILSFNAESIPEIKVINQLAKNRNKIAHIALRIIPNVDAHTHKNITTGLDENKFGISLNDMLPTINLIEDLSNVNFYGLHFHIGSQILKYDSFVALSKKINEIQSELESAGIKIPSIDVGGGLGVDYENPQANPIPDFKGYFKTFKDNLQLRPNQKFHCELGRALSAQYGALITRVVFIKKAKVKQFVIVDAGFTDLIRPALYQAHHKIINLTSTLPPTTYDVVGPICESTDVFEKDLQIPKTKRGDIIALLSAGAYGHVMASQYNARPLIKEYTSDNLKTNMS